MCGRYVTPEAAAIERHWHIGRHNLLQHILPLFNVAPTTIVPIIRRAQDGVLELIGARWGLIPHWWKQPDPPAVTFNARSEEAAQKPTWRPSLKNQRCLMPLQGWYEWQERAGASEGDRKVKQPYYIHAPEDEVLAFAGLWATWQRPDEESLLSCALLTKGAAASIATIHHRMPVIVRPEHYEEWLDPATTPDRVQAIIAGSRTDFASHEVSTRVNNARHNAPQNIQPLASASTSA